MLAPEIRLPLGGRPSLHVFSWVFATAQAVSRARRAMLVGSIVEHCRSSCAVLHVFRQLNLGKAASPQSGMRQLADFASNDTRTTCQ